MQTAATSHLASWRWRMITTVLTLFLLPLALTGCDGSDASSAKAEEKPAEMKEAPITEGPSTMLGVAEEIFNTLENQAEALLKDHKLTLKIFFESAGQAHQAAVSLQKQGFEVEVLAPEETGRTALQASTILKPDLATLKNAMTIVNSEIMALEGIYDSYVINTHAVEDNPDQEE